MAPLSLIQQPTEAITFTNPIVGATAESPANLALKIIFSPLILLRKLTPSVAAPAVTESLRKRALILAQPKIESYNFFYKVFQLSIFHVVEAVLLKCIKIYMEMSCSRILDWSSVGFGMELFKVCMFCE